MPSTVIPDAVRDDVETLWDYHQMHHELRPMSVSVSAAMTSASPRTLPSCTTRECSPLIVFTGANAPTTIERFPRGEAVRYREHALELGVPDEAILVEPAATNTGENVEFTRELLTDRGIEVGTAVLISRPYQQRRAYATSKKQWPELDVVCASLQLPLDGYVLGIGDVDRVINMMVGDTQRITLGARYGFAIPQEIPVNVTAAYERLVAAGYISRLL